MKKVLMVAVVIGMCSSSVWASYMADPNPGAAWYWGNTVNRGGSYDITWTKDATNGWIVANKLWRMNPSTGSTDPKYDDHASPYAAWPTISKTQDDSWSLNVDFYHLDMAYNGFGFVGLGGDTNCTNMLGVGVRQTYTGPRVLAYWFDDTGNYDFQQTAAPGVSLWVRALMSYDGATKTFDVKFYDRDGIMAGHSAGDLMEEKTFDLSGKTFTLNRIRIGNLGFGYEGTWAQDMRVKNFYYSDTAGKYLDYAGNEVPEPVTLLMLAFGTLFGSRARSRF